MLKCRACLWRCIQTLDAPTANVHRLRRDVNPLVLPSQKRLIRSAPEDVRQKRDDRFPSESARQRRPQRYTPDVVRKTGTRPTHLLEVEKLSRSGQDPWTNSSVAANQRKRARAAVRPQRPQNVYQTPNLDKLGGRDPSVSQTDWSNRKRELRHLQDPLELATFVRQELGKGRSEEMLQLVRMASHSMQCIVSWNHVIDHLLAKERVNDALKVYNDMKKRAQFPDSYTYTILLRGLSINAHHSGVLSKALSVYHSLSAPNSRVEPSIIHTNAALKVCARALDMDALWGIAGKIPESGPQAANVVTYITIINSIRQNLLLAAPRDETVDEAAARKERGIMEGRRMWGDIIARWRSADMRIDEELVCAMGRLLLTGSRPRDWDDVLSLVEQTMDIPRLVPRLGTAGRGDFGVSQLRAPYTPAGLRFDDDHLSPEKGHLRGDEFLALTPQGVGGAVSNPLSYVRPGNNTLSVIQEACQKVVANKAAQEYWDLLTDPTTYGITPDLDNLHMRLRNLRQNRASSAVVALLQDEMLAKGFGPRPGTFRIAMSTCVRDKNNHNSLKNASQILQIMLKTLEDADAKAVSMFAELALNFPLAKGPDLVDALVLLTPIVRSLRLQLGVGGERKIGPDVGASYLKGEARQNAILALRKVYSVYDRLLLSNMIPEEQKSPFKVERARLSSFIQRIVFKDLGRKEKVVVDAPRNGQMTGDPEMDRFLKDEGEERVEKEERHEGIRRDERSDRRASWLKSAPRSWIQNLDARGSL